MPFVNGAAMIRAYSASLGTESNSFSPIPTDRESFERTLYYPAGAYPNDGPTLFTGPLWLAREKHKAGEWALTEGLSTFAYPAGPVKQEVYEDLRDTILREVEAAMPLDVIVLGLHGAMLAERCEDCEGDILSRIRALVGEGVAIGAVLDPHTHMSQSMCDAADILICFKEYPHTDYVERAREVLELTEAKARGDIRPQFSVADCDQIDLYHTPIQPMRGFVEALQEAEKREGVLSVSLVHGFPWGDVPDMGTKVVVITDGKPALGEQIAQGFADRLKRLRGATRPKMLTTDEAIDAAMSMGEGPVVFADCADNAGGGAPSDSTYVLQRILERGVENVASGLYWDPETVAQAAAAGVGATIKISLGGKVCSLSGRPLHLEGVVKAYVKDARQTPGQSLGAVGDAALIACDGGVDVIVCTSRTQTLTTDIFQSLGVDLTKKKIVVVKSMQHFYSSFSQLTDQILYVDALGVCSMDVTLLPFTQIRRPKWPFDVMA